MTRSRVCLIDLPDTVDVQTYDAVSGQVGWLDTEAHGSGASEAYRALVGTCWGGLSKGECNLNRAQVLMGRAPSSMVSLFLTASKLH